MIPSFEAVSAHDEESRAFWQDRLASFGKLGGLFFLALGSIRLAVLLGRPEAQHWGLHEGSRSLFATAVALGAAWVGCRRGRRSAEALRWIDAASLVVAGRRSPRSAWCGCRSWTSPTRS